MIGFDYARPADVAHAVREGVGDHVAYLAGGTNLIGSMKENVARPLEVVDINRLQLAQITDLDDGGPRLGALATNADTAYDARV